MKIIKNGNKFWIEKCENDEGIIYFLYRKNSILEQSIPVAESRNYKKIIRAWERLEEL